MKRYLLSIVLGVFAVVAIAFYYMFGSSNGLPEYKLATIEGDPALGEKISLDGSYVGGIGSKSLTITAKGTKYGFEKSFYERNFNSSRYFTSRFEDMVALKKEHRNFMRAKGNVNSFYKDAEWLIYADIYVYRTEDSKNEWRLKLDLLEESTGKITHYEKVIENENGVWISVEDVQRIDNELHILGRQNDNFLDLVVNITDGEIVRTVKLESETKNGKDIEFKLYVLSNQIRSAPSEYAVLYTRKEKVLKRSNGGYTSEALSAELAAYSYRTGKLIPIPEIVENQNGILAPTNFILNGETLTYLVNKGVSLSVYEYDLVSGETMTLIEDLSAEQLGGELIGDIAMLAQNKIHLLARNNNGFRDGESMAVVVDATNGNVLYKGKVISEGPEATANERKKNLWVRGLYVQ
ncbi:hypothetical protein [Cohnella terricola]|uniref:Uncharacterized protein n=1 Tax=Cohnella terricola TaxID=1289167 RepID=A0A559JPZ4_9BACL|nr:hypothetical protein [Cohnella terricola]TVY01954.1 hypothetical protein FPZ45_05780 [Cohnella terricola]